MGAASNASDIDPKAASVSQPDFGVEPESSPKKHSKLGTWACNIGLAILFFGGLPRALHPGAGPADIIFGIGAALMGIFSLIRVPAKSSVVTVNSIAATAGMMLLPIAMPASGHPTGLLSTGLLYQIGATVELVGISFGVVGRIYLGRSFGLLPANRGIVTRGPFRLMRHPIYVSWFILQAGLVTVHPTIRNFLIVAAALVFMMWRVVQEEEHLSLDPEYRAYCARVRYRLIPGVF